MWTGLLGAREADIEFASSVMEQLQSTARSLIVCLTGVYLAFVLATAVWPEHLAMNVWLILPLVLATAVLAVRVLPSYYWLAQIIWQGGLASAITLAVYLFQMPEIAYLWALLPLVAVVTAGWPAGLAAGGVAAALAWWLMNGLVAAPVPASYPIGILIGCVISALTGWASARSLLTVTHWSLSSYRQAQRKVDEALEQRVELKQAQQDLLLANSELARLSDRLKAMYQVAEEARRVKEVFVANVSHELRTPLNMIIGFSEIITEAPQVYGTDLPEALLSDIEAIHLNSQNLARLVDDVLDLSQVEAGRMALSKERASLQQIADEAALAVHPLYASKDLYLRVEIPTDLPPVLCDSTRIRQVLLNLLSNAGRFTEEGGVRVTAERRASEIVVSVHDSGPGIRPEDRERLFQPFQQLDSSIRRGHDGSGLGLSISKRFIEMHGGKMWLESNVGVGTTFHFSLPLDLLPPMLTSGRDDVNRWLNPYGEYEYRARTRQSRAPAPEAHPRLVVLEKGETLRRLLGRYLHSFETVCVRSMEEAVRELSSSPAEALVVNAPPFGDGSVPPERLAGLPFDTPAMLCWLPGEDEAAKSLGALRYLVKPITREKLLSALDELGEGIERLLLVDDEPDALQLFARVLASAGRGYRILRAENGQRALSLLRSRQPDVMLLDLVMPEMDGYRVLHEKSRDPAIRDIPVILISARDPSGEPTVSSTLTITRGGGLSVHHLLAWIQAVSETLTPSTRSGDREHSQRPAG